MLNYLRTLLVNCCGKVIAATPKVNDSVSCFFFWGETPYPKKEDFE